MQDSYEGSRRRTGMRLGRSRSNNYQAINNTKLSNAQSRKSHSPALKNKPCDSHFFILQPLSKEHHVYYRDGLTFHFTHEDKACKPYPVFLKQFKNRQYIQTFGLESQLPTYRKSLSKSKMNFNEECLKIEHNHYNNSEIALPIPRHQYCQICKHEFEIYQKHVTEKAHLKTAQNSYGNRYISECIDDVLNIFESEKTDPRMSNIRKLAQILVNRIPSTRELMTQAIKEFNKIKKRNETH